MFAERVPVLLILLMIIVNCYMIIFVSTFVYDANK